MTRVLLRQGYRFAAVGLLATAVHVGIALLLTEAAAFGALSANLLAFCVALGVSYGGNRRWTFAATGPHRRQALRFAFVAIVALLLNQLIVHVAVDRWALDFRLALAIVVLVVPILSLMLNRGWVFAGRGAPLPGDTGMSSLGG